MKKILIFVGIGILLLCTACSKGQNAATQEQEKKQENEQEVKQNTEQLDKYRDVCKSLASYEDQFSKLISTAEEIMSDSQYNNRIEPTLLEKLSESISKAKEYKKYEVKTFDAEDEKLASEITAVEEIRDSLKQSESFLKDDIQAVNANIEELKKQDEAQLGEYKQACANLATEEKHLQQWTAQAESCLRRTHENDVTDVSLLTNLSDLLTEAKTYTKYTVISFEAGDDKIASEIASVEELQKYLLEFNQSFEKANNAVDSDVNEKKAAEAEKRREAAWPGTTYTVEWKDSNGYVIETKVKFGSWIKASDKNNLNLAWERAGGKGNAPDVSSISAGGYTFRDDNAVMTFVSFEFTNKTEGYDFSEQYPYPLFAKPVGLYRPSDSKLNTISGEIYFSNGPYNFYNGLPQTEMKSNHWGPVVMSFVIANVFNPNFDENGDPDLDRIRFYIADDNTYIKIPSLWKMPEPVSIEETDYYTPMSLLDKVSWSLENGKPTDTGWIEDEDSPKSLVLWMDRYEYIIFPHEKEDEIHYDRGGNSYVNINLSKQYVSFQGDITIPRESRENTGNLKVKVYGDGKLLWDSGDISGQSKDIHFNIDVSDVWQLKIESITDEKKPGPSVAIVNSKFINK